MENRESFIKKQVFGLHPGDWEWGGALEGENCRGRDVLSKSREKIK